MASIVEASGDLPAAQAFMGQLAGQGDHLLLPGIGNQLLALGTPTERRATSRVTTNRHLGGPAGGHAGPNEGALVLSDGTEHLPD